MSTTTIGEATNLFFNGLTGTPIAPRGTFGGRVRTPAVRATAVRVPAAQSRAADAPAAKAADTSTKRPAFWSRVLENLIAAQQRRADIEVSRLLRQQSDSFLASAGYTPVQIQALRNGRKLSELSRNQLG